eukprot:132375-Rhodomonas_salina.1
MWNWKTQAGARGVCSEACSDVGRGSERAAGMRPACCCGRHLESVCLSAARTNDTPWTLDPTL